MIKFDKKHRKLLSGIASYIPRIGDYFSKRKQTGGTENARYSYSVWLRHLVMANKNRLNPYPKIVAELGPGDSLGIGLSALISGCDQYYAFDIVDFTNFERNMVIFEELIKLFKNREPIPDDKEFPNVKPYLKTYDFPGEILGDKRLSEALESSRLETIRSALTNDRSNSSMIQFKVPWQDEKILRDESVDMIYFQAVLEHVDDFRGAYKSMKRWLKSGGYMAHQVDFKCHGTADEWNGHWAYSDFMWKIMKGKKPYLLNREPHSTHVGALNEEGFTILCNIGYQSKSKLKRSRLAPKFRNITDADICTSGAYIQAVKN